VLNKAVTPEELKESDADDIIIATGATPDVESYPGSDKKNVVSALDVLEGKVDLGKNVVILGGKGAAISTALYIKDKDKDCNVSIVGPQKKFGPDVNPSYIWRYLLKLKAGNVNQVNKSKVKEIVDDGVVVITAEQKEEKLPADTVIIADLVPNKEVKLGKYGKANVYMIGDAIQVRRGYGAVHDGYRMGMKVSFQPYQLMHRMKH
jgi:pyruvate/2-oxoglutarate dehydrogenase complex dihydrolipoamide dehydrogenase (E3) component